MSDSSTISSRLPKYSLAIVEGMINDRPSVALDEKVQRPGRGRREEHKPGERGQSGRERSGSIHQPSLDLWPDEAAGRSDRVDKGQPARQRHAGQKPHGNRKEDATGAVDARKRDGQPRD